MIQEQILLDRKDLRNRACWWVSLCGHNSLFQVTGEEARLTGKGYKCKFCGKINGAYVCDGFPQFSGLTIWEEEAKDKEKLNG